MNEQKREEIQKRLTELTFDELLSALIQEAEATAKANCFYDTMEQRKVANLVKNEIKKRYENDKN